ncbi:hypothetical protein [Mycobacterium sp. MS1601]|uniref:hypothetical protein n=1 Tax=Mycobacterium sp. MS1601 TaxID=1936029 RepID=UPI0012FA05AD|nr:hypothetical protein [Mycobacterium sp. MS1601]
MPDYKNLLCSGLAVISVSAALLGGSAAVAGATKISANPSQVSTSSGAGSQVRTAAVQGDVRNSGTQGDIRGGIKAVPGVKAHAMPTPNSCDPEYEYTCDD